MGIPLTPLARELLEGKNFAHVATLMKDGSPQVTVVWIDVEGDRILINTADHRAKVRNLRRDPRVAISITDQDQPERASFIRGRVTEITAEGADDHSAKMGHKYYGPDSNAHLSFEGPRLIIYIEAEHIREMGR